MSYMITFTGKHFNPVDTKIIEDKIDIRDICHALSLICRGNGHVKYFFSVAQHSINCYHEARRRGYPQNIQLACLLHDAAEAYLSDMIRPIKGLMPEYQQKEEALLKAIWKKYLNQALSPEEEQLVFDVDDDMMSYEFLHLMPEKISDRYQKLISEPDITCKNPLDAEQEMLALFYQLKNNKGVFE